MKHLWSSQTTSHKQKKNGPEQWRVGFRSVQRVSDPTNDFYKQFFYVAIFSGTCVSPFRMSCCATSLNRCDMFHVFSMSFVFQRPVCFQKIKNQSSTVGTRRTNNFAQQVLCFWQQLLVAPEC